MALKFKQPEEAPLKKVMVYGHDGTGKSTFAANYCLEHGFNPVVIDVEDTNRTVLYSQGRVLDINMKTDLSTFNNVKQTLEDLKDTEYDTIILDGVTSLLEMLTSNEKGLAKYSDRAFRFGRILQALLDSRKNIIFIGQIDMEVIFTEDFQSPKAVIKVNSLVNEKYFCYIDDKGNYSYEVKKYRTIENVPEEQKQEVISQPKVEEPKKESVPEKKSVPQEEFSTAAEIGEPRPEDVPLKSQCYMIKDMLEAEGKKVTKFSMRVKVVQVAKENNLPEENKKALLEYVAKHCPEELE